jgi:hypothetical protein
MNVIAKWNIRSRDKEGNVKVYHTGDPIEDLNEDDIKHLINTGAAYSTTREDDIQLNEPLPPLDDNDDILKDFKEAYEYDELKTEASAVGLTFPGNISFKNLVKLIVENGKVNEFFDDEE